MSKAEVAFDELRDPLWLLARLCDVVHKRKGTLKKDPIQFVANRIGVSVRNLYHWMRGTKIVPTKRLEEIEGALAAYGVGVASLLDEVADVMKAHAQALANDGEINIPEAIEIQQEAEEAQAVLALIVMAAQQEAGLR